MCGIVGIVSFEGSEIDANRLKRMRDVLRHRGPDGEGLWIDGPVGFGHRRLAIVDVQGGHQPMANTDGSAWLTYNGEIYNHPTLRRQLEERGHVYRTRCDTETILHLYDEDGEDLVDRLHGMFAFALWDRTRRRLMLARDRLGIKPLYYACTERELLFASEIKALFAAGSIRPAVNESIVPEFLATRFVSGAETFFHGVRKLLPGHVLTWSAEDGVRTRRYWQLPSPADDARTTVSVEAAELRTRLRDAVRRHLMSDVPLGVFLSGGLDSSALAVLTADLIPDRLQTFAVGFDDATANELPYARLVANQIGADHREVVVSPQDFFSALPRLVWQEDEPIAFSSSVPLYFVADCARDHVKVVLTGEGADELFLGYNRYRVTLWNARLGKAYQALPEAVRGPAQSLAGTLPRSVRRYVDRSFVALGPDLRSLYFDNFAVFPERVLTRLVDRRLLSRDPFGTVLDCYDSAEGGVLERMSRADLLTYLHELLMKQDQMSMAASIESRVPFLDDELVEHVVALPGRLKLRGWQTKAILREAVRDLLPREILSRRKMGFPVPVGTWLRGPFRGLVDEFVLGARGRTRGWFDPDTLKQLVLEHQAGANHGDRLWLLLTFEIWQRVFCDGEDPADIMQAVSNRARTFHARPVGQDGRPLAAEYGRPPAHVPNPVGARPSP